MTALLRHWTRPTLFSTLLLPLAALFALIVALRRAAYRRGWLRSVHVGVPVLVVGNITAGGSGKTPLAIWLVEALRARGLRPGVVSRGYGGSAKGCVEVTTDSDAGEVGDEPLLIHIRTGVPLVVGRDRVAAARTLLARHPGIDVVVSDDGLQHYRLARQVEVAVVDAATRLGNGRMLPAGPLREQARRLATVDAVVEVLRDETTTPTFAGAWPVRYRPGLAYPLCEPGRTVELGHLVDREWLAVAGIGRPQGFFDMLAAHGVAFRPRAFADHHAYREGDLPADASVLMTEKDGVKCRAFAAPGWWAIGLEVEAPAGLLDLLCARLESRRNVSPRSGAGAQA